MKIISETSNFFNQCDKQKVLKYLAERNVISAFLTDFFESSDFGLLDNAVFSVNGEEYAVSHFLSSSKIQGYDIWNVNKILNFENTENVAVAILVGDDVVVVNNKTKEVFLYFVQSGDGTMIKVANSLDDFIKLLS